jgi:AraC-like DNA-binding protein
MVTAGEAQGATRRPGQRQPAGWRVESERLVRPQVVGRPHPLVRPLLARDYAGLTPTCPPHRLMLPATASVSLVFKLVDSAHRPPAFLHGVHDRCLLMDGDCAPSYLAVRLAPLGAYRLLGRPVGELGDAAVDVAEVYGAAGRRLLGSLRDEPDWRRRFGLVDQFLMRLAATGPRPAPEVARAWQLVVGSGGTAAIARIAEDVGWSHKHLITRFREQIGVTPKTAARLVRLDRALARVAAGRVDRLSEVAAEGGFADQQHLDREFRTLVGVTPTEYRRRTQSAPGRPPAW